MDQKRVFLVVAVLGISLLAIGITRGNLNLTDTQQTSRAFKFSYQVDLNRFSDTDGGMEIWVPFPLTDEYQQIVSYVVSSEFPHDLRHDPVHGNSILHFTSNGKKPEDMSLRIDYDVVRSEKRIVDQVGSDSKSGGKVSPMNRYLQADRLVPVDGPIAVEADSVVSENMTDLEKARALYQHLLITMRYDKSGEGWGNGDALYACDARKGNCTDIHSLFIGMMRSQNIPARFVIGFPLPPAGSDKKITGYHCWAEFYIEEKGWIPVDISEAIKHPEKSEYFFGRLDQDRISFSIGRDIELKAKKGTQILNYFVYPYVMVNDQPAGKVDCTFDLKQL